MDQESMIAVAAAAGVVVGIDRILSGFKNRGIDLPKVCKDVNDTRVMVDKMMETCKIFEEIKTMVPEVSQAITDVNTLKDWHNHDDPAQPGVKVWWTSKYLVDLIRSVNQCNQDNHELLEEMVRSLKAISKQVEENRDRNG